MKVNNFFWDALGATRVTRARRKLIAHGDAHAPYTDHVGALAKELHPSVTHLRVTDVEDVSPTARRITFEAISPDVLPPFQAGQYVSLDLQIEGTVTTRPYSISSAPYVARRGADSRLQITVRHTDAPEVFAARWLYEEVRVGDEFSAHLPFGDFFYEPLRDARRVVALAGGSGITPFVSMAAEIAHGSLDCDLTILYGSVSTTDIVLREDLEALAASCERVRVVNVISGDEKGLPDGYEQGFISAELIRKYTQGSPSDGGTSYFVCGPAVMYTHVLAELAKLEVPERRIRTEVFGSPRKAGHAKEQVFELTVKRGLEETVIPARSTEPLAVALERAGIPNHTRCRSGACGYCRARLLTGEVYVPEQGDGRRLADKQNGYVHACSVWPLSDCTLEVPIV